MDKFIINGPTQLNGSVDISGSKNAALPIMSACIAYPGVYHLKNIPDLRDTRTMIRLLEIIGCVVSKDNHGLIIDSINCNNPEAPYKLVKTMRASFYVLGPLLSRFKYAKVSLPGGCAWGPRPIDFHLKAFESLGAKVTLRSGYIITEGKLSASTIKFPKPSVGATGNVLMACVNLNEDVIIKNAAMEPEIVDLCNFLIKVGMTINGIGTSILRIKGVDNNKNIKINYSVIPDRIEAGTFLIACALSGGKITLNNTNPEHLLKVIDLLKLSGMDLSIKNDKITITSDKIINSINVTADVYPGFPTDLQAQWIALMCKSRGQCSIKDLIYIDRFTHVPELIRMGAQISMNSNEAIVSGVDNLYGTSVMSTDIRASASLIIAAIASIGETHLTRIYHIDRGYESIEKKLINIGANIKRVND